MDIPFERQDMPPLKLGKERLMLVAPVQRAAEDQPILYSPPQNLLEPGKFVETKTLHQNFTGRRKQNSPFTSLGNPKHVSARKLEYLENQRYHGSNDDGTEGPIGFKFKILAADIYRHFEMDFIVAFIELSEPALSDRDGFQYFSAFDIAQFEEATSYLMKDICKLNYADHNHIVRWVGRTLILGQNPPREGSTSMDTERGTTVPKSWFQQEDSATRVKLDTDVTVEISWGNNVAWSPLSEYKFQDLQKSAVFAQYLWCFVNDIDTKSIDLLRRAGHVKLGRTEQDKALETLVRINYNLAVASMFFERLGTEANSIHREAVYHILEAWGYRQVIENISARLSRLENILNARADILIRRSNRVMEFVLFVLSATGLVSLTLSFIGTAYSGESGEDGVPWYPDSQIINIFRSWNLDTILIITALISIFLIIIVTKNRGSATRKEETEK